MRFGLGIGSNIIQRLIFRVILIVMVRASCRVLLSDWRKSLIRIRIRIRVKVRVKIRV